MLGKTVTMYVKKATILADSTVYGDPRCLRREYRH